MRARKVDNNHNLIRAELDRLGCNTHSTRGDWDLTVNLKGTGFVMLIEVKAKNGKLTPNEIKWKDKLPIYEVRTIKDAQNLVDRMIEMQRKITQRGCWHDSEE